MAGALIENFSMGASRTRNESLGENTQEVRDFSLRSAHFFREIKKSKKPSQIDNIYFTELIRFSSLS
jgi:hypothetical protein